jgi:hypothetical protein
MIFSAIVSATIAEGITLQLRCRAEHDATAIVSLALAMG